MKVRAHVFVSGRVHGVFFRSETRYEARKHDVKGWIRNLRDGRVEAVFEGEEEDVREMIRFCEKGPPSARVRDVNFKKEDYTGEFNDFQIRFTF